MPVPAFLPSPGDKWYYSAPYPTKETFSSVCKALLLPFISPRDITYGRDSVPRSPREARIENDHDIHIEHRKVYYGHDSKDWICYSLYTRLSVQPKADMVFVHGINDYGAKYLDHAYPFLDAGYRTITLDLPNHGRSSGLHAYVPDLHLLADSLHLVLCELRRTDHNPESPRKTFLCGHSLGGFTVADYVERYRNSADVHIAAVSLGCPMIAIAPETRPNILVEYIGRALAFFFGPLPFVHPLRGQISNDPSVESEFLQDPMTYHGRLRIATGLACVTGMDYVQKDIKNITVPIQIVHGTRDRICSFSASREFFDKIEVSDKEYKVYDGVEHLILRKGKDEQDDADRQRALADTIAWFDKHL